MTPKEKAVELVDKYSIKVEVFFTEDSIPRIVNARMRLDSAKQCALIAVDEIIDSNPHKLSLEGKFETEHITYDINFWEEVKQEIENL